MLFADVRISVSGAIGAAEAAAQMSAAAVNAKTIRVMTISPALPFPHCIGASPTLIAIIGAEERISVVQRQDFVHRLLVVDRSH
jgi:hypothetical protein